MKEFGKEYIGKYKDQKAYSYLDSGFVGEILVSKINEGTKIALFYSAQGSMSIHNKKEVWVVVNPDGMIITAWCFCMTRASRCCKHVTALLYKKEYANANNFCSPACTSIPYGWNKSTTKIIEPKINRKIQHLVRKKECNSLIYLIHQPIFKEMLQESAYENSFILCHYQDLLLSYLNLLRVCQLKPP